MTRQSKGLVTSPRALDEIPKPVVVALLMASHADDHRPFTHAAQLLEAMRSVRRPEIVRRDDNSRRKMQNLRGDSSGAKVKGAIGLTVAVKQRGFQEAVKQLEAFRDTPTAKAPGPEQSRPQRAAPEFPSKNPPFKSTYENLPCRLPGRRDEV